MLDVVASSVGAVRRASQADPIGAGDQPRVDGAADLNPDLAGPAVEDFPSRVMLGGRCRWAGVRCRNRGTGEVG